MKRLGVLAVLALVLACAGASGATADVAASCATGTAAVVNGRPVCLRAGKRCNPANDRQVKPFGYRCRRVKATRGKKRPKSGTLVLANPTAARYGEDIKTLPDGTVSKKVALEAFAAAFGPLPGVKVSK